MRDLSQNITVQYIEDREGDLATNEVYVPNL